SKKIDLYQKTGIQDKQLDAYWEQFQCLAASDYPGDPHGFEIAIDRRAFNQCFIPNSTVRDPAPNLLYDRMFAFYDTNDDGLIGFEEFLAGIASINKRDSKQDEQVFRAKIFRAYDVDNDGFVDRKDFLRMFRGYQTLTMELTKQVVSGMEDEFFDEEDARELIAGSQPLSSIFAGPIPLGQPSQGRTGKSEDRHGDDTVSDGQGVLREEDEHPDPDREDVFPSTDPDIRFVDYAEQRAFGDCFWLIYERFRRQSMKERWDGAGPMANHTLKTHINASVLQGLEKPKDITESSERLLKSCADQEDIGRSWWERTIVRRRAVDKRRRARQFCLDDDLMAKRRIGRSGDEVYLAPQFLEAEDLDYMRITSLDRIAKLGASEDFRAKAISAIEEQWPKYSNVPEAVDRIEGWIRNRGRWYEMALNLAENQDEKILAAASIVGIYLCKLEFHEQSVDLHTSEVNSVCNGARSSSVPPADVVTDTAQNHRSPSPRPERTINVQYKGRQATPSNLESEANTVRGVIHQVTEDAMNELLNPMFKLRESMALQEESTRARRTRHHQEIEDYLRLRSDVKVSLKELLGMYQERWYRMSRASYCELDEKLWTQVMRFCLGALDSSERKCEQVDDNSAKTNQAASREADGYETDGCETEDYETEDHETDDDLPESLGTQYP
ncbi:MAG: hypothetical protein Q9174_006749, partial [Haloplaca sp. 1 TL-2023]